MKILDLLSQRAAEHSLCSIDPCYQCKSLVEAEHYSSIVGIETGISADEQNKKEQ